MKVIVVRLEVEVVHLVDRLPTNELLIWSELVVKMEVRVVLAKEKITTTTTTTSRHDVSTKLNFPNNDYSNRIIVILFLH